MIAWLAPGQGSERPGMGRTLAVEWPEVAALIGSLEPGLHGTERIQPALVATALAAARILRTAAVPCDATAGHSVGELAAWSIAGGLTASEAVALAQERGRAMAAANATGGMWAVDDLPEVLPPDLVVAVHNPGQVVLSGTGPAPPGARPVPVAGPWHSPGMAPARTAFTAALDRIEHRPLAIPIASNHDGRATIDDALFRDHLVRQLTSPVQWTGCLRTLGALGCTDAVLLGPGKTLAQHVRRALPHVAVHRTDRPRDVRATIARLGADAGAFPR